MAVIWAEGFDHYGDGSTGNGGRDYMLAGAWASFSWANGTAPVISSEQSRTGAHSLKINYNSLATDGVQCRRVLGAAEIVVGSALGVYFNALPNVNKEHGFEFRNNANECIAMITVQSDGAIGVYGGATRTLIGSSDPVITAASWQHIEAKIICDTVVGECQVKVNGVDVLHITDQNLGALGATQIVYGMPDQDIGASLIWYIDDIVTWNDTGTDNTSFIGQCRVETVFPTSDTAQADWTLNGAASGFDCVNDATPDNDTTFLQGSTIGDVSEFGIGTLPPEATTIKGVYIPALAKLDDAGTGSMKVGLKSGVDLAQGPEITLTTAYTYHGTVIERDPATDSAWTKAGLEAALLQIEKAG